MDEKQTPTPTLITSLQNIMKLPIDRNNEWTIIAYVINKDIIKEKEIDPLRAVVFSLGSFHTLENAEKEVKKLIEVTGHPYFKIIRYGSPVEITTLPNPDSIYKIPVDIKGKLINLEEQMYKEQMDEYEEKIKREKEIGEECQNENDKDHIEHYKRLAYLTSKHFDAYTNMLTQSKAILSLFNQRKEELLTHLSLHPEHEVQFLPYLYDKLIKRGEKELYEKIEKSYKVLKTHLDI